jgi:hypothetical protein
MPDTREVNFEKYDPIDDARKVRAPGGAVKVYFAFPAAARRSHATLHPNSSERRTSKFLKKRSGSTFSRLSRSGNYS